MTLVGVLAGLMQDIAENTDSGIPGLRSIPLLGDFFSNKAQLSRKTELVIFIRPVVVKSASVNGDYRNYRYLLPGEERINQNPYSEPSSDPRRAKGQVP